MRRRGWRPSSRNANRVSRTADPRIADSRLLRRVPDMATVFDRLDATLELPEHEAMVLESVSQLARDVVAPRAADYDRREACPRSEERRVGRECVSTCRYRWSP